jgi:Rod binding domain-containing protein
MKINPTQLGTVRSLRPGPLSEEAKLADAQKLKDVYTEFVGKTFFGQLMKSMRSIVGKPAYFHGGQAEEVFGAQLDQQMAEHMSKASASQIAEPMFRQQFPQQADLLTKSQSSDGAASLADLSALRPR